MNKNEKFVISINRELGSGGRTVGEKLAAQLGVSFYDKAVVKGLCEKYHLTVEEVERLKGEKTNWWSDFKRVVSIGEAFNNERYYKVEVGSGLELITTDALFREEKSILEGIAEQESCVLAGRCAFFIFRNHPNHLSILIQAPKEQRIQRVMRKQGITHEKAEKIITTVDKMRENYVSKYAATSRYDTRNYDLTISMEGMTEDDAVAVIMEYINRQG